MGELKHFFSKHSLIKKLNLGITGLWRYAVSLIIHKQTKLQSDSSGNY